MSVFLIQYLLYTQIDFMISLSISYTSMYMREIINKNINNKNKFANNIFIGI